jgi:F-type H+-transporting ATPase subunit b
MRNRPDDRPVRAVVTVAAVLLCFSATAQAASDLYMGDPGQMIAAIAVFLVLFLILRKWAWKPLLTQLRAREERISLSIQQTERREKQAQDMLASYREKLDVAEKEAQEMLTTARKEVAELKEQALSAARDEAREFSRHAREEIDQARADALRELRETTARLAVDIAGRVLRKHIGSEDQDRLLHESMEDIGQRVAEEP